MAVMSEMRAGGREEGNGGAPVPAIRVTAPKGKEKDGWANVEKGQSFRLGK